MYVHLCMSCRQPMALCESQHVTIRIPASAMWPCWWTSLAGWWLRQQFAWYVLLRKISSPTKHIVLPSYIKVIYEHWLCNSNGNSDTCVGMQRMWWKRWERRKFLRVTWAVSTTRISSTTVTVCLAGGCSGLASTPGPSLSRSVRHSVNRKTVIAWCVISQSLIGWLIVKSTYDWCLVGIVSSLVLDTFCVR